MIPDVVQAKHHFGGQRLLQLEIPLKVPGLLILRLQRRVIRRNKERIRRRDRGYRATAVETVDERLIGGCGDGKQTVGHTRRDLAVRDGELIQRRRISGNGLGRLTWERVAEDSEAPAQNRIAALAELPCKSDARLPDDLVGAQKRLMETRLDDPVVRNIGIMREILEGEGKIRKTIVLADWIRVVIDAQRGRDLQ